MVVYFFVGTTFRISLLGLFTAGYAAALALVSLLVPAWDLAHGQKIFGNNPWIELHAALAKLRQWPAAPGLERLLDALPRPARPHKSRVLVRQGEQLLPLPVAQAAWFVSRHDTTTLVAADGRRFVVDYTLEQLEGLLDPVQFFRLNRQCIAQLPAVRRLLPYLGGKLLVELHPAPSEDVLVSKERASAVKAWLEG